ncbi:hypothetical protein K431DRAFT_45155 [Polychaeton citri CBS 116435]|uniref:Uncharacterized protein n=1 Tax=Polychaeton citri CBS 116435 TaxID=1314669 RepID=A0A9P4QAC3_9PEZI|nr:hypothetical protein K431DRAFT_45155 [Polychaeton citri CBS 116435]
MQAQECRHRRRGMLPSQTVTSGSAILTSASPATAMANASPPLPPLVKYPSTQSLSLAATVLADRALDTPSLPPQLPYCSKRETNRPPPLTLQTASLLVYAPLQNGPWNQEQRSHSACLARPAVISNGRLSVFPSSSPVSHVAWTPIPWLLPLRSRRPYLFLHNIALPSDGDLGNVQLNLDSCHDGHLPTNDQDEDGDSNALSPTERHSVTGFVGNGSACLVDPASTSPVTISSGADDSIVHGSTGGSYNDIYAASGHTWEKGSRQSPIQPRTLLPPMALKRRGAVAHIASSDARTHNAPDDDQAYSRIVSSILRSELNCSSCYVFG